LYSSQWSWQAGCLFGATQPLQQFMARIAHSPFSKYAVKIRRATAYCDSVCSLVLRLPV
jgi:hypothetical protein